MNSIELGRTPVPQAVVRRIQEMIAAGEVKPGERLPSQRDLATSFNISRASLREALTALETLGLVRIEPNRGVVVCLEPAKGGWRFGSRIPKADVFQLRFLIESYTAKLAAGSAQHGPLDALSSAIEQMRMKRDSGDLEGFARADLCFHRGVAEVAGNQALIQTYDSIVSLMLESHRAPLVSRARLSEPIEEHETILAAIKRGDVDGAAYFARNHVVMTADRSGIPKDIYLRW